MARLDISKDMQQRALAWALSVFAALVVAAWFVPLENETARPDAPLKGLKQDRFRYERLADNLLLHGVYSSCPTPPYKPELERMPGFPAFWAGIKWLSGGSEAALIVAHAALHVIGALAIFVLVVILVGDPMLALITEIAWLLSPVQLSYLFIGSAETLTTAGNLVGLTALVAYFQYGGVRKLVLAFVALAAAAYARPMFLILPPFLIVIAFIARRRSAVRPLLIVTLGFVLAFLPWAVRNYQTFGKFTPTAHNWISWNFCAAATQYVYDEPMDSMCLKGYPPDATYPPDPLNECDPEKLMHFDALMREQAITAVRDHLGVNLLAMVSRPLRNWNSMLLTMVVQRAPGAVRYGVMGLMLVPFIAGCVLLWRRSLHGWIVGATVLHISLAALPGASLARYTMPVAFLWFIAVIYVLTGLFRGRRAILAGNWRAIPWP